MIEKMREGGMLVAKIHQVSGRVFAKKLKEHGIEEINPAQGRILFVLWQNDGIPIKRLAEKTMLEKSTMTGMLDRLEETGYITRAPSKQDRREIMIWRTEKDRALEKTYREVSEDMATLFYKGFLEREIDRLEADLHRILDNLADFEDSQKA